jgi:hypothetical protein
LRACSNRAPQVRARRQVEPQHGRVRRPRAEADRVAGGAAVVLVDEHRRAAAAPSNGSRWRSTTMIWARTSSTATASGTASTTRTTRISRLPRPKLCSSSQAPSSSTHDCCTRLNASGSKPPHTALIGPRRRPHGPIDRRIPAYCVHPRRTVNYPIHAYLQGFRRPECTADRLLKIVVSLVPSPGSPSETAEPGSGWVVGGRPSSLRVR